MCIKKILGLFKRKPAEKLVKKQVKTWLERMRERWPTFRFIRTAKGGLNMPVFQSCPACRAGSKRQNKTVSGAIYRCRHHGEFLVKRGNI